MIKDLIFADSRPALKKVTVVVLTGDRDRYNIHILCKMTVVVLEMEVMGSR